MESFTEIVNYAIKMEEDSMRLYQRLASHCQRAEVKKVFLDMVGQEEGHKKKLENIKAKGTLPLGKLTVPDEDMHLAEILADVDADKPDLTYQESLVIGMKLEKAALSLYRILAELTETGEAKQLFLYLADEEARHKHLFEAEFDDLMP